MTTDSKTLGPGDEEQTERALALMGSAADTVIMRRDPVAVLDDARKAAAALTTVLAQKKKPIIFNDEQYLENEDWQTVGHFYGCTAKTESDSFVQYGDVHGFEATSVVIDRTGREIGRATSMCLNDEDKWSARPKYEYHYVTKNGEQVKDDPGREQIIWEGAEGKKRPKKVRVRVADEPVPLFQLRSMAQTRSQSKAFKGVFGFVPVLGGYKTTPAEELPSSARNDDDVVDGEVVHEQREQSGGNSKRDASFDDAEQQTRKAAPKPQPKQAPKPQPVKDDSMQRYRVTRVLELKKGDNAQGPWILYGIETTELGKNVYITTLDKEVAKIANKSKLTTQPVEMLFDVSEKNGFTNRELTEIKLCAAERESGEEG